ncbi:MAG TPA: peptidoglycan DD-metalloendopeptidase family protein [Burkholderiaceae bacterium]|nr:peptidoglycan DD-metalloendopeptidase family protein [Burkholderiaceae bacterium]
MGLPSMRAWQFCASVVLAFLLASCASPHNNAPVEDRGFGARPAVMPPSEAASGAEAAKPLPPGSENAGKPGYYTVKQGDTMIRIGLETGQNWRDIAKWNNIDNVNLIEVGQVLRVVPPSLDPALAAAKGVGVAKVETRPLGPSNGASAPAIGASSPGSGSAAATVPASGPIVAPLASAREGDDDVNWGWPANGAVTASFDEGHNKGLSIAGRAGDAVLAAADGRVVYAGSGLRGYGNLVIVKHNNNYLTAYAHNQTLLVKEDQVVRRGQKIAEMGSSDSDHVQLHFEIRRQGKPVDPAKLLPPR